MTQEEKARAYDDAIKKAESLYKASEPMSGCNVIIETLFPELKESEDEKIRKKLIKHLKELSDWKEDEVIPVKNPSYYRQWVSWLEKQGQVKESAISQHEIETCKENDNSLTSEDEKIRKALIKLVEIENIDGYLTLDGIDIKDVLDWLERQGEHANFRNKIQVGDKVTRNEDGVLVNLSQLKRVAKPSEKQGKQKFEMKTAEESLGIDSDTYNKIVDECIYGDDKVEPKFKVGDKIYLKPEYRMPNDDTPIANTVKEIRRIDDKHYRFDGSYIFIEDQDKYELVEQKPEENKGNIGGISANWSEEDEVNVYNIIHFLEEPSMLENNEPCKKIVIDWLQSLKGRVGCEANCTTTKEWSEEEIEKAAQEWDSKANFNPFYMTMEGDKPTGVKQHITTHKESFKAGVNWILKYGVQPKQEWSEEDEQHIDSLLKRLDALCRNKFERTRFAISEDREWLKSLRPQNTWKPSEGDIIILEKVFKGELEPKIFQATLQGILEQLKKLKEGKI